MPEEKEIIEIKAIKETAAEKEDEKLVRVAIYSRTSTVYEMQDESLKMQTRYFMKRVEAAANWRLVGIYIDRGKSGRDSSRRIGFNRMLRHCEEGRIDKILCKSFSRFGRNAKEIMEVIGRLKEMQIGIYFEQENFDTLQVESEFILAVLAATAHDELCGISENANWSFTKRFQQGIPIFRRILGYDVKKMDNRQAMIILDDEAKIVREMFDLALRDVSYSEIARILMEKGYKTAAGRNEWTSHSVKRILGNERYKGSSYCQKTYTVDYLSYKQVKNKGDRSKYFVENSHPAIIREEIFEQVQKIIASKARASREIEKEVENKVNLFSGRLICGACGATYHRQQYSRSVGWRCSRSIRNKRACNTPAVKESHLEEIMRKAFEIRYDFASRLIFREIIFDVREIEKQDDVELRRIYLNNKWNLYLEMETSADEKERELYKEKRQKLESYMMKTERYWEQIENDRIFRKKILELMETCPVGEGFTDTLLQSLKIEHMRALIMEITVDFPDSYTIKWADGADTVILEDKEHVMQRENCDNKENKIVNSYEAIEDNGIGEVYTAKAARIRKQTIEMPKVEVWSIPALPKEFDYMYKVPRKRVCAYVRVSTRDNNQQSSFHLQILHYTKYIQGKSDFSFAGIYADEGASGTSVKGRTSFQRMIEDCQAGHIDLILTKSISRFARNTVDFLYYIRLLKSLPSPVGIYFEKENLNSLDADSEFLLTLLSSLNQAESEAVSFNTRWGRQKRYQMGIVNYRSILGYDRGENGKWVINENEAAIIRRIYDDYLAGKSGAQIAKELYREGIKSKRGHCKWSSIAITGILRNEKYKGDVLTQKKFKQDVLAHKMVKNIGQMDQYLIENHHPAIIDRERWTKTQSELDRRKICIKRSETTDCPDKVNQSVFYNMLFCSECGSPLGRSKARYMTGKGERTEYVMWRCNAAEGRIINKECDCRGYRQEKIESEFMDILFKIGQEQDRFMEEVKKELEHNGIETDNMERMEILREEIIKKYEDFSERASMPSVAETGEESHFEMLKGLAEEIEVLKETWEALNGMKKEKLQMEADLDWFLSELKKLKSLRDSGESISFREDIFKRIVTKGIVYGDGKIVLELVLGVSKESIIAGIPNIKPRFANGVTRKEYIKKIFEGRTEKLSKREVGELCEGISLITIKAELSKLVEEGYLQKIGNGRYTKYARNKEQ